MTSLGPRKWGCSMEQGQFAYFAIFQTEERTPPAAGVFCTESSQGPLRAVTWGYDEQTWIFNPGPAARLLFDDQVWDLQSQITRAEAERTALDRYGVPLPSEEELHRICEEGEQATRANQ
jgi:hypothetical protein